jgi:hypothetical protein
MQDAGAARDAAALVDIARLMRIFRPVKGGSSMRASALLLLFRVGRRHGLQPGLL